MNNREQHRMILVARRVICGLASVLAFADISTELLWHKATQFSIRSPVLLANGTERFVSKAFGFC
jgi:hypothetical protein